MHLPASPSMADDVELAATRALPGQPFAVVLARLASVAGTWDKNDHGCEGIAPESDLAKAHHSAAPPSLLNIRIHAEKEAHPYLFEIGRFKVTIAAGAHLRGPGNTRRHTPAEGGGAPPARPAS